MCVSFEFFKLSGFLSPLYMKKQKLEWKNSHKHINNSLVIRRRKIPDFYIIREREREREDRSKEEDKEESENWCDTTKRCSISNLESGVGGVWHSH